MEKESSALSPKETFAVVVVIFGLVAVGIDAVSRGNDDLAEFLIGSAMVLTLFLFGSKSDKGCASSIFIGLGSIVGVIVSMFSGSNLFIGALVGAGVILTLCVITFSVKFLVNKGLVRFLVNKGLVRFLVYAVWFGWFYHLAVVRLLDIYKGDPLSWGRFVFSVLLASAAFLIAIVTVLPVAEKKFEYFPEAEYFPQLIERVSVRIVNVRQHVVNVLQKKTEFSPPASVRLHIAAWAIAGALLTAAFALGTVVTFAEGAWDDLYYFGRAVFALLSLGSAACTLLLCTLSVFGIRPVGVAWLSGLALTGLAVTLAVTPVLRFRRDLYDTVHARALIEAASYQAELAAAEAAEAAAEKVRLERKERGQEVCEVRGCLNRPYCMKYKIPGPVYYYCSKHKPICS
jgi:hypothetical protein